MIHVNLYRKNKGWHIEHSLVEKQRKKNIYHHMKWIQTVD